MPTKCSHANTFFKVAVIVFTISCAVITTSCNNDKKKIGHVQENPLGKKRVGMDTAKNRWGSWNILLKDNTNGEAASSAILAFENAMIDKMNSTSLFDGYNVHFQVFFCPCDSLLYNIGATLVDGSGYTVTSPAPPPPPAGSGDVLFISNNNQMADVDDLHFQGPQPNTNKDLVLSSTTLKLNVAPQTLAIIDTGIDTSYFSTDIKRLMRSQSVFNVVGGNVLSFFDDHPGKHGTLATALALKAAMDQNAKFQRGDNFLPSLMILKALDSRKQGSTFTVSCALSYAIQHNAAVINASLGYYDYNRSTDSVFRHYFQLTKDRSIPVFAAAGNLPGVKVPNMICDPARNSNLLQDRRRFFPACFDIVFDNIYTVTTLTDQPASCFYQNYSPTYVTLGIRQTNRGLCCHFNVPFASGEGTSFATPVACGTALAFMLNGRPINEFASSLSTDPSLSNVTKAGHYMNYSSQ